VAHDKNALQALQERAATGDADAQCGLGKQYEHAVGVPQDNSQAILWLRKAADQGNIAAQVELGVVFDKMQDYEQAMIWYRKAAEQGDARAEYNIGLAYQNGESVPKDKVMVWLKSTLVCCMTPATAFRRITHRLPSCIAKQVTRELP
jgi:TPR repeat protein